MIILPSLVWSTAVKKYQAYFSAEKLPYVLGSVSLRKSFFEGCVRHLDAKCLETVV